MEIVVVALTMFWLLVLSMLGLISAPAMIGFVQILAVIAIAALLLRSISALARSIQTWTAVRRHPPV